MSVNGMAAKGEVISVARPVGRPPGEGGPKNERFNLKLTASRKAKILQRASNGGLSPTQQIEQALDLYESAQQANSPVAIQEQIRVTIQDALKPITGQMVLHPSVPVPEGAIGTIVLGSISAGSPSEGEASGDRIMCSLHPTGPDYAYVKVTGDSLDKLLPTGVYALIRRGQLPRNGDIVAVELDLSGNVESTLKVFRTDGVEQWFEPASSNPAHLPIVLCTIKPKKKDLIWLDPQAARFIGVFTGHYAI